MGFVASVCQPSTLRMLICPDANSAQNNIAAVSADGRTVWVLIRRLNSSCSRSIALVVRRLRHWLGGRRVKVKRRSPASSRLSATARCFSLHLRMKALRRTVISSGVGRASFFEGVLVYVTGWFELLQEHQQGHIQVD
jgi:hypothetical protein